MLNLALVLTYFACVRYHWPARHLREASQTGPRPGALRKQSRFDAPSLKGRFPRLASKHGHRDPWTNANEAEMRVALQTAVSRAGLQNQTHGYAHSPEGRVTDLFSSRRVLLAAAVAAYLAPSLSASAAGGQHGAALRRASQIDIGRSAFKAVEAEFPLEFSALLARFLVNNDQVVRRWWEQKRREAPSLETPGTPATNSPNALIQDFIKKNLQDKYLIESFSTLIASVEVGLERFEGVDGVTKLASQLNQDYKLPAQKRRLAQLFSLLDSPSSQPVATIKAMLGEADNAYITSLTLTGNCTGKSGDDTGYIFSDPVVYISSPPSSGGRVAKAKPILRSQPFGSVELVGLEVVDGGSGYNVDEPPTVVVKERRSDVVSVGCNEAFAMPMMKAANERVGESFLAPSALESLEQELQDGLSLSWEVRRGYGRKNATVPTLLTLPAALVPKINETTGTYRLPISIPPGAFGIRAEVPVEEQESLALLDVSKIFLAGALCSGTARGVLVPLDVVKTVLQQEPERYSGPVDCAKDLVAKEGPGALLKGLGVTVAGYSVAGALAFGLIEVFSRALRDATGPGIAALFSLPLLISSAAAATVIVSAALCPFETIRLQSVKTGKPGLQALQDILDDEGLSALFRGIIPILLKEVPYIITKFVVFDTLSDILISIAQDAGLGSAPPTALAGAVAGVAAVIISQPADAVFTLANKAPDVTVSAAVAQVLERPGVVANGIGPRLLSGSILVSLQFFLFTLLRSGLDVSKDDLTLVWDALAPLLN